MKIIRICIAIAVIFSCAVVSGNGISLLQQEDVEKKITEIEKRINRERYLAAAIITGGLMYTVYYSVQTESNPVTSVKIGFGEWIKKSVSNTFSQMHHLLFTTDGWWDMVKCCGSCASTFTWALVTQEAIKKLWHPHTLHWYVHAHVPYKITLASMQDTLDELRSSSITPERTKIYRDSLRLSCVCLTKHSASLCAYMLYKSKELLPEEKQLAQRMTVDFFNAYNEWLAQFKKMIDAPNYDYIQMYEHLVVCEKKMQSICKHFANVEGETIEERRAIEG